MLIVKWLYLIFLEKQNWLPETEVWFEVEIELYLSGFDAYSEFYKILRLNWEEITNLKFFLSLDYFLAEGVLLYSSSHWTSGREQNPIFFARISLMLGNFLCSFVLFSVASFWFFVLDLSKIVSSWVLNNEMEFVCLECFAIVLRVELFWLMLLQVGFLR